MATTGSPGTSEMSENEKNETNIKTTTSWITRRSATRIARSRSAVPSSPELLLLLLQPQTRHVDAARQTRERSVAAGVGRRRRRQVGADDSLDVGLRRDRPQRPVGPSVPELLRE